MATLLLGEDSAHRLHGLAPRKAERLQALRQPLEGLPGRRPYDRVDVSGGASGVISEKDPRSACSDDDEGPSLLAQHARDYAERLDVLRSKRH
jgi:hypothetical protein